MQDQPFDTISLINWAHMFSPGLGFIAYFYAIENVPRQNHLIFIYLVICFFADIVSFLEFFPSPTVVNLHDIAQFIVIVTIYVKLFNQRGVFFLAATIIIYLAGITSTLTLIGLGAFHTHMWSLSGFLISVLCLVFVNAINVWPKELGNDCNLYNTLIMNTSFLFYFLATFLFFLLAGKLLTNASPEEFRVTWAYHNAIGLVKNTGLAVAIFLTGKAKTPKGSLA